MLTPLLTYLVIINLISFFMMGFDKGQAKRRKQRVPEKRLFIFAALGGALGGWTGMRVWRHKTKHTSFVIGMPTLLVVNALCVYLIWGQLLQP
ncbi:DUF1294 domain-containing protein [Paenibacillus eucommiae]|uniref:Uncharacterized membrane protein YsdA (DUF1294 family) n=1 Tax=Paenibacillus eucommiae TaxID=1355755 RepID=A0ABS4IR99_9BACL|nr:DUF1294 domain-containing protein [Paenibacillus eucommiae]MBP1990065.1 uncharacterized membrane protein YsdA (DUF1294 family) [Paenibacillus eucommiae]